MTIGTAMTGLTISAFTSIIRSNMAASNTLALRIATALNDSIANTTAFGYPVASFLKSPPGIGLSARTGVGIAATILSSTKIPTTMAGTCSTTFTLASTST